MCSYIGLHLNCRIRQLPIHQEPCGIELPFDVLTGIYCTGYRRFAILQDMLRIRFIQFESFQKGISLCSIE